MRIGNIAIDCNDLDTMKAFWARLTGYSELYAEDGFAILGNPEKMGWTKVFVQKVPEPRVGKNRLHIDLYVPDREAAAVEVEAAGGSRVAEHDNGLARWLIMADPEGNEFCLVEPPAGV